MWIDMRTRWRGVGWALLWLVVVGWAVPTWAAVAGGGEALRGHAWWVRPELGDESVWVSVAALDWRSDDAAGVGGASAWSGRAEGFVPVRKASGRVIEQAVGASADGRVLWAAFRGGAAVSWRLVEGGVSGVGGPAVRQADGPRLPGGGSARALAVVDDRPWVLWRGDRADAAEAVLAELTEATRSRRSSTGSNDDLDAKSRFERDVLLLKLPPPSASDESDPEPEANAEAQPNDGVAEPGADEPLEATNDADPALDLGRDLLLTLRAGRWSSVDLPESWPGAGAAHLLDLGGDFPALLAGAGSSWTLWRWSPTETNGEPTEPEVETQDEPLVGSWNSTTYELPQSDEVRFVAASGQAVAVCLRPKDALLLALRAGGAIRLGTIARHPDRIVPPGRAEPTVAIGLGDAVGLLELPRVRDPLEVAELDTSPAGVVSALTLDGEALRDGEPLPIRLRPRTGPAPSQTVLMAVLMASTLIMLVFWRRDPAGQSFRLPDDTRVAPLDRRAVGGFLDLGVGFGVAYLLFGLTPIEIVARWPGRAIDLTWVHMQPAAVAIGVTVLHTAVGEALFARSIGKAVVGLRVVDREGRDARGGRGLVRCLFKSLDLVAYLLLILLVVSPMRQRLGDLVAGTAVVARKPAEPDGDFPA